MGLGFRLSFGVREIWILNGTDQFVSPQKKSNKPTTFCVDSHALTKMPLAVRINSVVAVNNRARCFSSNILRLSEMFLHRA